MKKGYWAGVVVAVALFASAQASATLINFEDAPGKGLADNDPVTNQYAAEGVTFSGAVLEKTGNEKPHKNANPQGFLNDVTQKYDDPYAATPGLGDWFLRTGGNIGDRGGKGVYLTVDYASPVYAASGQIWDIDGSNAGTEQWQIVAYLNGVQVALDDSPKGSTHKAGSLNGLPWTFNLASAGGFDSIEFWFTGTKEKNVGLAFDNFNTSALTNVPEPKALWMFGLGALLIGLFAGLRRWDATRA